MCPVKHWTHALKVILKGIPGKKNCYQSVQKHCGEGKREKHWQLQSVMRESANSKMKNLSHLLLLSWFMSKIYSIGTRRVKTAFCQTYAISVSLIIEVHKNNIDNFTLYYQKVLLNNTFLKVFLKRNRHFQRFTAKYSRLFWERFYPAILRSLANVNLF